MRSERSWLAALVVAILIALAGCGSETPSSYRYQAPASSDDGLDVGSLADAGIDPALIEEAVNEIYAGRHKEVHSMLIYHDGKLVVEEYFNGYSYQWDAPGYRGSLTLHNPHTPHPLMSVSKSFTSALIGIAIDRGYIERVDQSIFDYLPGHQHLATDGRDQITIEHLLTMSSGLQWKEWGASNTSLDSDLFKLWVECADQVACVLSKPLASEPGTSFVYNSGGMVVLGEIIKHAAGMDIEEFSAAYLFGPLEIEAPAYPRFASGIADASGSELNITPRDMLKLGITYMNGGVWNGEQVLPAAWVEKSSTPFAGNQGIKIPGEDLGKMGYAYSWWTKQFRSSGRDVTLYGANGWGGQKIMVLPDLDTVVVFTGGNYTVKNSNFRILEKLILPALR